MISLQFSCQQLNAKQFSMHLSIWHTQWSILLHSATFSSFKFPFCSESPSNNQTTVYKIKAAMFQYVNITKQNSDPSAVCYTFAVIHKQQTILFSHGSFNIRHLLTLLHRVAQSWTAKMTSSDRGWLAGLAVAVADNQHKLQTLDNALSLHRCRISHIHIAMHTSNRLTYSTAFFF